MMKLKAFAVVAVTAGLALASCAEGKSAGFTAADSAEAKKLIISKEELAKLTPEQKAARKARLDELLRKYTGGMVRRPGFGKGLLVVVDAQKTVPAESLKEPLAFMEKRLRISGAYRKATLEGMPTKEKVEKAGASLAVFVVECDKCENALLVAPESRWALVNVKSLAKDNPKPDVLARRVRNEVSRALGFICGSANSQYPGTIMDAVKSASDLDAYPNCDLPLDQFQRIVNYLRGFGVEPFVEAPYRAACQQGWAPDPVDEYQKAIWDETHKLPDKPIKIEFDPKKDAPKKDK